MSTQLRREQSRLVVFLYPMLSHLKINKYTRHLISVNAKLSSEAGRFALEQFGELSRSFCLYTCCISSGTCHTVKMLSVKSSVAEYFEVPPGISGLYKAKCIHCGAAVSGGGQTISNLRTHLKRKHLKIHEELMTTTGPLTLLTIQPDYTAFLCQNLQELFC